MTDEKSEFRAISLYHSCINHLKHLCYELIWLNKGWEREKVCYKSLLTTIFKLRDYWVEDFFSLSVSCFTAKMSHKRLKLDFRAEMHDISVKHERMFIWVTFQQLDTVTSWIESDSELKLSAIEIMTTCKKWLFSVKEVKFWNCLWEQRIILSLQVCWWRWNLWVIHL